MLYEFRQGHNATKTTEAICSVYGVDALNVHVCQKWFAKFRSGDFDLEDKERSGKPQELETESCRILRIHQTWHHQITIYSVQWNIFYGINHSKKIKIYKIS